MPNRIKDETGKKYGRLTVLGMNEERSNGHITWRCQCDCGNIINTSGERLRNGSTQSCGCLQKERHYHSLKKYNEYKIVDDIVYVKMSNSDNYVLCDIDDWDNLKKYYWRENPRNHYIETSIDRKTVKMHRLLLDKKDGYVCDHINHNRLDNRRCNLRYASTHANNINTKLSKNNTSGYTGVSFIKNCQKWLAYIWIDRKMINLGYYKDINDAIQARKDGEEKYHMPILEKETLQMG